MSDPPGLPPPGVVIATDEEVELELDDDVEDVEDEEEDEPERFCRFLGCARLTSSPLLLLLALVRSPSALRLVPVAFFATKAWLALRLRWPMAFDAC